MGDQVLGLLHDVAILFPAFLFVLTVRGFSKALAAKMNGDDTAEHAGFLTLNPLAHVNVYGLATVLLVLFLIGGLLPGASPRGILLIFVLAIGVQWTFIVPVDPRNFKALTRGMVLTLLSGPLGCFVSALLFLYLSRYAPLHLAPPHIALGIAQVLATVVEISLFFGVIDLVPIPPFDGGYLLSFLAPPSWRGAMNFLEEYALFIFLALFILPGISDVFFTAIFTVIRTVEWILMLLVF